MKASTFLRISFGLIVFHLLGHTVGHFTWRDTDNPEMQRLISEMDSRQFDFMGTLQTLGGHHEGYSLMLGITLIMLSVITWMFGAKINTVTMIRPFVLIVGGFFVVFGIVEMIYFFPLPGVTSILAGGCQIIGGSRKS